MTEQKPLAIVDDDEAVLDSLDVLLRSVGHETVLYSSASDFLGETDLSGFGCVLLDVRLPDGDGLDVFRTLLDRGAEPPVIIMTGHGDVPMAVKAMRMGARDFLQKPFKPDSMLEAVQEAMESEKARQAKAESQRAAAEKLTQLTARETDVMHQLVIGRPNKVIASELGLSPRTVEIHRARVMEKTGSRSLSHLVRMAISAGVDPEA
ncbi:MAG: response regulator [Pseudomonadota bacterium]